MSFIDKRYVMASPADVREILAGNNDRLKMMLSLIYKHNAAVSKAGYALKMKKHHERNGHTEVAAWQLTEFTEQKNLRVQVNQKLKQLLSAHGMRMMTDRTSRVSAVIYKKKRGQQRRSEAVIAITQQYLYVFSDLYNEEQLMNIVLNEEIMGAPLER